jgi:hypothetical protein
MTLSLRKTTLALIGGSTLAVAMPSIANAGAPDGYFDSPRYIVAAPPPPPPYAEVVPVYPAPVYPAPAPVYAAPAPIYDEPIYPPAYAEPAYDPSAVILDNEGYVPGPELDYVEPDGALAVSVD